MERFLSGQYCIRMHDLSELYRILDFLARKGLTWISGFPADIPPFHESEVSFPITIFYRPRIKRLKYDFLGISNGLGVLSIHDFPEIEQPVPLDLSFLTE